MSQTVHIYIVHHHCMALLLPVALLVPVRSLVAVCNIICVIIDADDIIGVGGIDVAGIVGVDAQTASLTPSALLVTVVV